MLSATEQDFVPWMTYAVATDTCLSILPTESYFIKYELRSLTQMAGRIHDIIIVCPVLKPSWFIHFLSPSIGCTCYEVCNDSATEEKQTQMEREDGYEAPKETDSGLSKNHSFQVILWWLQNEQIDDLDRQIQSLKNCPSICLFWENWIVAAQ